MGSLLKLVVSVELDSRPLVEEFVTGGEIVCGLDVDNLDMKQIGSSRTIPAESLGAAGSSSKSITLCREDV